MALSPAEIEVLRLSLKVAFWAMLASLPLALVLALILARGRFPGKTLFDGMVHLPLVLPPVVIGYLLLIALSVRGLRLGTAAKRGCTILMQGFDPCHLAAKIGEGVC